jgi:hypothetical protein
MRHRGDRPKIAYHPPCDHVKITYGDPLVTGDVYKYTQRENVKNHLLNLFGVVSPIRAGEKEESI